MRTKPLNLLTTPVAGDAWEVSGWKSRALLQALAFGGTALSIGSVAWAIGGSLFYASLILVAGAGSLVSSLPLKRRLRLSILIYPAGMLAVWMMHVDLLAVVAGGSLFALAKLLAVIQAMVSFNLRSLRSLYDSFLLSLSVILLVSDAAFSPNFAFLFLAFGIVALLFLAAAHPVNEVQRSRLVVAASLPNLAAPVVGIVVLTLGAAVVVFLVLPQSHAVVVASPLPSRLDLTIGRPPPISDLAPGDPAPQAQFLPSRGQDGTTQAEQGSSGTATEQAGVSGALDGTISDTGAAPSGGPLGEISPPEYATLGYAGEREKDVVMYVRSPLASYWRGQVLDEYDGRGWAPKKGQSQVELDRQGRFRFKDAPRWPLITERYVQSYFPQVPQGDAVFTGYSPGYIALTNPTTAGPRAYRTVENVRRLQQAESYRIVSPVPELTPEKLLQDSAASDYPLKTLPIVPARVFELATAIVEGSTSDYQKAARLEQYLLTNYDYDLRVPPLSRSGDVVDKFLFDRRAGYCAQFATTMAVMARLVGLPARVALGYVPGQYSSLTGAHTVRLQNAHAWVEVKFDKNGWVPFDPTPRPDSPWALDPGFTAATKTLQQSLRGQLKDLAFGAPGSAAAFVGLIGAGGLLTAAAILGAAMVLMAIVAFAWRRGVWTRRARARRYTTINGPEREAVKRIYVDALRLLARKGYPRRQPHQSPNDYLGALQSLSLHVPQALGEISREATHALYNPAPFNLRTLDRGKSILKVLRALPRLT